MSIQIQPQEHYAKDEQDVFLGQSIKTVKRAAFYMRQAIEESNMDEALRHSAVLLGELRTSLLGPQKYYELYMAVNNEMRDLEGFILAKMADQRAAIQMYQKVQHAGNVVPRLYLLCTAGACAIRGGEFEHKMILKDMEDMCKGVQHPIRGLFLRAYLVQTCRGLLPDCKPEDLAGSASVNDSIRFLLENFIEMNKLWVRMKRQGGTDDQARQIREKERSQLADLVGKNLTQLSQLDHLEFDEYKESVLPKILEQVIACKDDLAQGYLMECVTAAFPDEFQVGTLDQLLDVLPKLEPKVHLSSVLGSLLDRLSSYTKSSKDVIAQLDGLDAFKKISKAVETSIEAHKDISGSDIASMYGGLIQFAEAVYPDRLVYVDNILEQAVKVLEAKAPFHDAKAEKKILDLLMSPLQTQNLIDVLEFKNFVPLVRILSTRRQRDLARQISIKTRDAGTLIISIQHGEMYFELLKPLIDFNENEEDEEDILDDANDFAKSLHSFNLSQIQDQITLMNTIANVAMQGGTKRVSRICPTIVSTALDSIQEAISGSGESADQAWYTFIIKLCLSISDSRSPGLAIRLLLSTAISASEYASLELVAYECMEQAFLIFEDAISDSKESSNILYSIIDTLYSCHVFEDDNRATLSYKTRSYCSKLLRRKDQCRAVLSCSHIFWQQKEGEGINVLRDGKEVLSCLKRALRIANAAQQQNSIFDRDSDELTVPGHLFVEILNKYFYYYLLNVPQISSETLNQVLELAASEVHSAACQEDNELQSYYQRTVDYIRHEKQEEVESKTLVIPRDR